MPDDHPDDWEAVGRRLLADEAFVASEEVADTFHQLHQAARNGETLTADDVRQARWALNRAQRLLEDDVAPLTEGVDPWSHPPDATFGEIRAWIGCDGE